MKRIVSIIFVVVISIFLISCKVEAKSHLYKIEYFSATGELIRTWDAVEWTSRDSSYLSFITTEGEKIHLSGFYIMTRLN